MTEAQNVVVTAGASGIGLEIARTFARNGATVAVLDVDRANLLVASQIEGINAYWCDVADAKQRIKVMSSLTSLFDGVIDVLVNNLGIAGDTEPADSYRADRFRQVLDVNVDATFAITQHLLPHLRNSTAASIITMSSVAGKFGYPNRIAYSASKHALVGFSNTLAKELGAERITANTIHPGIVQGERIQQVLRGRAEVSGRTLEEEIELAYANQSIPDFVNPRDIAELVRFLAGPFGRMITGQQISIDGGAWAV